MSPMQTMMRRLKTGFAAALISLQAISPAVADERLDWWTIDSEVGRRLITGEKNLVDWAGELAASEAETSRDAVVKLNVCMRAALDDEACDAVRTLWRLGPEKVDNYLLRSSYSDATDDYHAWKVARTITETFAPRIHEIALGNRLFKHYRAKDNERRWSDGEFVAWLDARVDSVLRYDREQAAKADPDARQPRVHPWQVKPIDHWRWLRLRHLAAMGRAGAELKRMAGNVRARPADAGTSIQYLTALAELRRQGDGVGQGQLDWMAEVCRPTGATDLRRIASLLVALEQYQPAETLFRRAIDTKVTDEEISRLAMKCQAMLPEQTHRLLFQVGVREELAKCLLKLDEPDLSQQVMVEAANIRQKHGLPLNPYLSGRVQRASGARVIEGRIRGQEEENKGDPKYWRKRADYYRGRGEVDEEESALRRGLTLCPPGPQARGKASMQMRHWLLSDLTKLLVREQRTDEAVELLLKELDEVPIDSASSKGAARLLAYDLPKHLDADEPILWNWLARREKWDNPEERLVWRMLESVPPGSRDKYFIRTEKLAMPDGADATRAATLGWVLNRMGEAARSMILLKHALENATDDDLKQRTAFTLFESYLDLKDWRAAESIFGLAERQLTPSEDPERLGRVATIAAAKGARKDAMRIFRRVANCNLRDLQLVGELSELGLRDELRAYYGEVRRQLPTAKLDGLAD